MTDTPEWDEAQEYPAPTPRTHGMVRHHGDCKVCACPEAEREAAAAPLEPVDVTDKEAVRERILNDPVASYFYKLGAQTIAREHEHSMLRRVIAIEGQVEEGIQSNLRSHSFPKCQLCGAMVDDPEAFDYCSFDEREAAAAPLEPGEKQHLLARGWVTLEGDGSGTALPPVAAPLEPPRPIHVKHDDWWCECGLRVEDCDDLQESSGGTAQPPLDRNELSEAIFESGVRQTMSQSEQAADNILAELALIRLASPGEGGRASQWTEAESERQFQLRKEEEDRL